MSNKVDLLFKRTLENHRIEPGKNTWNAIEGKLVKKNKSYPWIRLAASFVLGALLITFWTKPTPRNMNPNSLTVEAHGKVNAVDDLHENRENTVIKTSDTAKAVSSKKYFTYTKSDIKTADLLAVNEKEIYNEIITLTTTPLSEEKPTESNMPVHHQPGTNQSIVLVYTLPTIKPTADQPEERYDNHKIEKPNNLKKIWELAGDLRTGESNLNSVRQTKNEILAFHFMKNEKNN